MRNEIRRAQRLPNVVPGRYCFVNEDTETGQWARALGAHPSGYISDGADCRKLVSITGENRKNPAALVPSNAEGIDLFRGLLAYCGVFINREGKVGTASMSPGIKPGPGRFWLLSSSWAG